MRTRFALSLAEAEVVVAASLRFARNKGLAVTAAVVDDAGIPVLVCRLDEASAASVATAIEKARSAAFTGLPTFALESMIAQRPALVTLDRVAVEGGLPIVYQSQEVGGIGISGALPGHDAEIAQAGLAALGARP
jgi:glc operon protein GlcG